MRLKIRSGEFFIFVKIHSENLGFDYEFSKLNYYNDEKEETWDEI